MIHQNEIGRVVAIRFIHLLQHLFLLEAFICIAAIVEVIHIQSQFILQDIFLHPPIYHTKHLDITITPLLIVHYRRQIVIEILTDKYTTLMLINLMRQVES